MPESDGQITSRDICNQAVVERILADESVTSLKIYVNLQSDTYDGGVVASDPGSTGWRIERNTGDAAFNNVVIRGQLIAGTGSDVDWSYISNVTIDNADITSLSASKITAGTITAESIRLEGTSETGSDAIVLDTTTTGAVIESDNFVTGSTGFRIESNGDAEFRNVTIEGQLIAGTGSDVDWSYISAVAIDTADITNLAVTTAKIDNLAVTTAKIDSAAITNAKIANLAVDTAQIADAAITNAKIANATIQSAKIADLAVDKLTGGTINTTNITVASTFTLGSGGVFRTASSGKRVEITNTLGDRVSFYSGSGSETAPGRVLVSATQFELVAPVISGVIPQSAYIRWQSGLMLFKSGNSTAGVYRFQKPSSDFPAYVEIENSSTFGGARVRFGGSSDNNAIRNAGSGGGLRYDGTAGHTFYANGTQHWLMSPGGQFKISGTSGELRLAPRSGSPDWVIYNTTGYMRFWNGADRFTIGTDINIGLPMFGSGTNTTTSSLNTWRHDGSAQFLRFTSARRFKKYIRDVDFDSTIEDLKKLRPREWKERAGEIADPSDEWIRGFVADEVAEVMPTRVQYDNDGEPFGFEPSGLVPDLLLAVQHLLERVEQLESQLAAA